jgi:hypothetical protein
MIDRDARDKMVLLIRRLVAGRITNDKFEAGLPAGSSDPAIMEVYHRGLWSLYSDLSEHRLAGRRRLPRDARREVARYILFLKSDLIYEWPCRQPWKELLWMLAGLLTLGLAGRLYWALLGRHGEVQVWPFLRQKDFEQAVRHPCYLAGAA